MAACESATLPALSQSVARDIVSLFKDLTGRGPERCTAQFAGEDMLVIVAEGSELPMERTLRGGGHGMDAAAMRATLQDIMGHHIAEIVERHTGRGVEMVLASAEPDHDVMAELVFFERA